ncbi:hypothetical protein ACRUKF_17130, partial [Burkholderia pseudomallei]
MREWLVRMGAWAHGHIGASAHRHIGASAHRRIGASAHRRIGMQQYGPDRLTSGEPKPVHRGSGR